MSANLRPDLTDGTVLAYKTRVTARDRKVGFGAEGRLHESAFSGRATPLSCFAWMIAGGTIFARTAPLQRPEAAPF